MHVCCLLEEVLATCDDKLSGATVQKHDTKYWNAIMSWQTQLLDTVIQYQ